MNALRVSSRIVVLLSALVVLSIPLYAQGTSSLRGVVFDPQKASVVGAIVTLTDKDTGVVRMTPTQDGGQYSFVQIKPGSYALKVEAPGFGVQHLDGIKLLVDTPVTLDVSLQVATSTAQVNVTADDRPAQLSTVDASVGNARLKSARWDRCRFRPGTQLSYSACNRA